MGDERAHPAEFRGEVSPGAAPFMEGKTAPADDKTTVFSTLQRFRVDLPLVITSLSIKGDSDLRGTISKI